MCVGAPPSAQSRFARKQHELRNKQMTPSTSPLTCSTQATEVFVDFCHDYILLQSLTQFYCITHFVCFAENGTHILFARLHVAYCFSSMIGVNKVLEILRPLVNARYNTVKVIDQQAPTTVH